MRDFRGKLALAGLCVRASHCLLGLAALALLALAANAERYVADELCDVCRQGKLVPFKGGLLKTSRALTYVAFPSQEETVLLPADNATHLFASIASNDRIWAWGRTANATALWTSDGTAAGTRNAAALPEATYSLDFPTALIGPADAVYFSLELGNPGTRAIWRSDGTASGTRKLADLPGQNSAFIELLSQVNGRIFWRVDTPPFNSGFEVWAGDETGVRLVMAHPAASGLETISYPSAVVNGKLLYRIKDAKGRQELWATDGGEGGAIRLAELSSGDTSGDLIAVNSVEGQSKIYLEYTCLSEKCAGTRHWVSDGSAQGTRQYQIPGWDDSQWHLLAEADKSFLYVIYTGNEDGKTSFHAVNPSDGAKNNLFGERTLNYPFVPSLLHSAKPTVRDGKLHYWFAGEIIGGPTSGMLQAGILTATTSANSAEMATCSAPFAHPVLLDAYRSVNGGFVVKDANGVAVFYRSIPGDCPNP